MEETGFRIQVAGGRAGAMLDYELNYGLRVAFLILATADCLLLTADCVLHLRGVRACGMLRLYASPGQDVIYAAEKRNGSNFKK
jgi:hypothetical protein